MRNIFPDKYKLREFIITGPARDSSKLKCLSQDSKIKTYKNIKLAKVTI